MDLPPEVLTTVDAGASEIFRPRRIPAAGWRRASSSSPTWRRRDHGTTIVAGNERVLRARLADAKFFWDQDRKTCAGRAPAGAEGHRLPRQARHRRRQGRAHARRWPRISPLRLPGAEATVARRAAPRSARPISPPAWWANSRNSRASWGVITPGSKARRPRGQCDRRALRPRRPQRQMPHRAALRGGGAGRQDRYARRLLGHGRKAHGIQGSLRAAPRGPGCHPSDPREWPALQSARQLRDAPSPATRARA